MTLHELVEWLRQEKSLGVREATKVALAIAQWSIASHAVGHFASLSEFEAWSGESNRTVERRRSRVLKVLTEAEFHEVVEALQEPSYAARARGARPEVGRRGAPA